MKFLHLHGTMRHPNENCRGYRDKRFHFSQADFEGFHFAADSFQFVDGVALTVGQCAWRKDGQMGRQMRQFRMQFPSEFLDELPNRFSYVSH